MIEIKTTQEIIGDLGISLTRNNNDKIRDFTKEWISVENIKVILGDITFKKESLFDLIDMLNRSKSLQGIKYKGGCNQNGK